MATPPPKRKYKDPKTVKKDAYWDVGGLAGVVVASLGMGTQKLGLMKQKRKRMAQTAKKKKNGPS